MHQKELQGRPNQVVYKEASLWNVFEGTGTAYVGLSYLFQATLVLSNKFLFIESKYFYFMLLTILIAGSHLGIWSELHCRKVEFMQANIWRVWFDPVWTHFRAQVQVCWSWGSLKNIATKTFDGQIEPRRDENSPLLLFSLSWTQKHGRERVQRDLVDSWLHYRLLALISLTEIFHV